MNKRKIETIEELRALVSAGVHCWVENANPIDEVAPYLHMPIKCVTDNGVIVFENWRKSFTTFFGCSDTNFFCLKRDGKPTLESVQSMLQNGYTTTTPMQLPPEFIQFCEERGVTPAQVLAGFIGDLCRIENADDKSFNSHGSDERRLAYEWFERVVWNGVG